MHIVVDLTEEQVDELGAIATRGGTSRATVIEDAVKAYLASQRKIAVGIGCFGLWKDSSADGLSYQEELRKEW
jgi:metal-responsive CopG/Arc/MetJ family transcriptional regulator